MSHDVVAVTGEAEPGPETEAKQPAARRRRRVPAPLTSIALIAAVLFALGSVGSPLLGAKVYGPTDELVNLNPYYQAGYTNTKIANAFLDDIYTAQLPNEQIYGESVRAGHPAGWNPYVSGGAPLGSVPSFALWSPVSLPYLLLPAWLAILPPISQIGCTRAARSDARCRGSSAGRCSPPSFSWPRFS